MSGQQQNILSMITRLLLLFKMMATATIAGAFDPLDIVILEDMIPSAGSKCNSNFQSIPVDQTTNYTFEYDASQSSWSEKAMSMEEALFLAEISHEDGSNQNRSWTLRIGQGGNIYSFRSAFGEAVPPQVPTQFVDEVFQSVSVNQELNNNNDGFKYYIHQAGIYQTDGDYTIEPFFSPSLMTSCDGTGCSFGSW